MQYPFALFLICLATWVIDLTVAQSFHVIKVGDTGSFYDPLVTTARTGDTVSFQWTGMFHSVTQSSFDNPCTPLPGGFDSGVTGNPPQQLILPEWNLTITDDTQPIWFFCKVTAPEPHCTSGMVGAINADLTNGNQSYTNFSQNAKLLQNPPMLPHGQPPVLTGVGAFALSTPSPVLNATNASSIIPTSTATTSSSVTPSTSITPATQTQQGTSRVGLSTGLIGGIAGGSAGALLLVILLVLFLMSYRRGRRYRREAKAIQQLHSKPSRDLSQIDRFDLVYNGTHPDPPGITPSQQVIQLHRSQGSLSVNESLDPESTSSPSLNIRELAAEIAKNMRQDIIQQERSGITVDLASLETVPEQMVSDAVSRAGSSRITESSGRGRQLPRPPQTRADVRSVDTLPAYAPGHSR